MTKARAIARCVPRARNPAGSEAKLGLVSLQALALATFVCVIASSEPRPARAQDADAAVSGPIITVRGDGESEAQPTFASLSLVIESTGATLKDASDAQRSRSKRANDILDSLKSGGVSLERSDFTLQKNLSGSDRGEGEFVARTTYSIRLVALDKLNDALSALVSSGLFDVGPATFRVEDPAKETDAARALAIKAARVSAEAYAAAGGFKIGALEKVLDVTPQSFSSIASAESFARAPTLSLIPPRRLAFRASALVTWRISR